MEGNLINIATVSYRTVIKEVKETIALCRWASSHYWRCRLVNPAEKIACPSVKIIYLSKCDYICFLFSQYHSASWQIFQAIPKTHRYFYGDTVNRQMKSKTWTVPLPLFMPILEKLKNLSDLNLEFLIWQPNQIPKPFQPLALTFEEKKPKERWFSLQSSLKS